MTIITGVIKSSSLMGCPCGTHDKDEKCGSACLANGPSLDLSRLRYTTLGNIRNCSHNDAVTHPTRPESSVIDCIQCLKCHAEALVINSASGYLGEFVSTWNKDCSVYPLTRSYFRVRSTTPDVSTSKTESP